MNFVMLGIFAIIFLILLGLISNTVSFTQSSANCKINSTDAFCNNFIQMTILTCHLPIKDGFDNSTSIDTDRPELIYNGNGTYYECGFNQSGQFTSRFPRDYTATEFSVIPTGFYNFIGDTLTQFFYKTGAIISLFVNFISPINFNILGFGITDIGAFAQIIVITVYAMCYLVIGVMMYKVFSPFSGAS